MIFKDKDVLDDNLSFEGSLGYGNEAVTNIKLSLLTDGVSYSKTFHYGYNIIYCIGQTADTPLKLSGLQFVFYYSKFIYCHQKA